MVQGSFFSWGWGINPLTGGQRNDQVTPWPGERPHSLWITGWWLSDHRSTHVNVENHQDIPLHEVWLALQCGPELESKNTAFDLVVSLKLSSQGQCLCVGFDDGSSSLCCGRHQALSPNVNLKIARPLDVWLALAVSLGRLRSEHIAHNPLHMQSYIIPFHVVTACQLFSYSFISENMLMIEWYWHKEINCYIVVFCVLSLT